MAVMPFVFVCHALVIIFRCSGVTYASHFGPYGSESSASTAAGRAPRVAAAKGSRAGGQHSLSDLFRTGRDGDSATLGVALVSVTSVQLAVHHGSSVRASSSDLFAQFCCRDEDDRVVGREEQSDKLPTAVFGYQGAGEAAVPLGNVPVAKKDVPHGSWELSLWRSEPRTGRSNEVARVEVPLQRLVDQLLSRGSVRGTATGSQELVCTWSQPLKSFHDIVGRDASVELELSVPLKRSAHTPPPAPQLSAVASAQQLRAAASRVRRAIGRQPGAAEQLDAYLRDVLAFNRDKHRPLGHATLRDVSETFRSVGVVVDSHDLRAVVLIARRNAKERSQPGAFQPANSILLCSRRHRVLGFTISVCVTTLSGALTSASRNSRENLLDSDGDGSTDDEETLDDIGLHTDVNVPALLSVLHVEAVSVSNVLSPVQPNHPGTFSSAALSDVVRALRAAAAAGSGSALWVRQLEMRFASLRPFVLASLRV